MTTLDRFILYFSFVYLALGDIVVSILKWIFK